MKVWAHSYPLLSSYKAHGGATTTIMSAIVRVVRGRGRVISSCGDCGGCSWPI